MKGDMKVIVSGSSGHIVIDESSLIKRILLYLISAIIGFGAMFLAIMMDSRAYAATLTEIFMGTFEDAYTGGDPDEIAQMPETGDVITIYINIDTTTSPYPRQVRIFASNTFSYIRSNRLQLKLCYIILRNILGNIKFTHELIDYLFIRSIKTTEILDKLNNRCLLCYTRSKSTHICHLLSYFFVIFTTERYQYRSVKAELECARKTERGEKKPERERVSMKEKLPEKKAEVAKNEANREHPVPSKTKETALG